MPLKRRVCNSGWNVCAGVPAALLSRMLSCPSLLAYHVLTGAEAGASAIEVRHPQAGRARPQTELLR